MNTFYEIFLFLYFRIWYLINNIFYDLILVLSDTHSAINSNVLKRVKYFKVILHAGDMSTLDVIEDLKLYDETTKIYVVSGNTESIQTEEMYPEELFVTLSGINVYMTHELLEVTKFTDEKRVKKAFPQKPDVVISGHTHKIFKKKIKGILFFNPGSAGPKRFRNVLPSFGVLKIRRKKVTAKVFRVTWDY